MWANYLDFKYIVYVIVQNHNNHLFILKYYKLNSFNTPIGKPIIQPKRGQPSVTIEKTVEESIVTEEAVVTEEVVVTEETVVTEEAVLEKSVAAEKLAERIELNKPLEEESVIESGETPIVPIQGTRYAAQLQASGGKYILRVFAGKELKKEVTLRSTGHYDIMGSIASSVSLNISPHILSKTALSLKKLLQTD